MVDWLGGNQWSCQFLYKVSLFFGIVKSCWVLTFEKLWQNTMDFYTFRGLFGIPRRKILPQMFPNTQPKLWLKSICNWDQGFEKGEEFCRSFCDFFPITFCQTKSQTLILFNQADASTIELVSSLSVWKSIKPQGLST